LIKRMKEPGSFRDDRDKPKRRLEIGLEGVAREQPENDVKR